MMPRKKRLTVTVDTHLIEAGNRAVRSGLADSLSAWVNEALAVEVERERKLEALGGAIRAYEAEFGEIRGEELSSRRRLDRESAIVVRARRHIAELANPDSP